MTLPIAERARDSPNNAVGMFTSFEQIFKVATVSFPTAIVLLNGTLDTPRVVLATLADIPMANLFQQYLPIDRRVCCQIMGAASIGLFF